MKERTLAELFNDNTIKSGKKLLIQRRTEDERNTSKKGNLTVITVISESSTFA